MRLALALFAALAALLLAGSPLGADAKRNNKHKVAAKAPPTPPPKSAAAPATPSPSGGPPPPTTARLATFIRMFNSRCITFIGDSVAREMHFNLLLFAFGCNSRMSALDRKRRFVDRGVNQTARCAYFTAHMKDRSNRVTRVPVDREPSKDIVVRFIWARYMDELNKKGQLGAMLDLDACDLYVLNTGFWPLRMPRTNGDIVNASAQFRGFIDSLGWNDSANRRLLIRRRIVWRSATLIEVAQGVFANKHIKRFNARVDNTARSYGIPVYNFERLFDGIQAPTNKFRFTAVRGGPYPAARGRLVAPGAGRERQGKRGAAGW
jgi:hypothetical protein